MAPSSRSSAGDDRILSYHDAILLRSDLVDLSSPSFLSDRVLHFYFTHLSLSLPHSVLLLPPSLSFLLSVSPIPLPELDLPSKTLILFPVNDNPEASLPNGGSHWSLLVYFRPAGEFVHHDSSGGMNSPHAKALYRNVRHLVGGGGAEATYVEGFTPQQRNGYDCGVYVMAIAKVICEWKGDSGEEKWFGALREEVDEESVRRLRMEVLALVRSLMPSERHE